MERIEVNVSLELFKVIEQARDAYNRRKLIRVSRNSWIEAVLAEAARAELAKSERKNNGDDAKE